MKRWIALGAGVLALLAGVWLLGRKAIDPKDFAGNWYGAEDGCLYRFQEGIIQVGEEFKGAYCFSGDQIVLFTVDPSGTSRIRELYVSGEPKGELLCENPDGTGRIAFSRSNIASQSGIKP